MINNDWIKAEKHLEMLSYKHIKEEIWIIEGIVYRGAKVIIPNSLQKRIAKIGPYLRHVGSTKIKQLLRGRYWLPKMNNRIDGILDQYYECKSSIKRFTTRINKTRCYTQEKLGDSWFRLWRIIPSRTQQPSYCRPKVKILSSWRDTQRHLRREKNQTERNFCNLRDS